MIRNLALATIVLLNVMTVVPADEVDDLATTFLREKHLPGLSLAIVRDGQLIKEAGHGLASLELEAPARADTVYEIGSVTKSFTATAVMLLVEDGKLDLDTPIDRYLDGLPDAWKPVTARQLLNHTSGLPNYTAATDFAQLSRNEHTQDAILDLVRDKPLRFAPGDRWEYSNTGYFLLGMIVEKTSGMSFADFLQRRILGPLDMSRTRPTNPGLIVSGRAEGYGTVLGLVRVNRDVLTPSSAFSAGFLISTVGDLAKWDAAQRDGLLLRPESLEIMWLPARLNDGSRHPYGFGWGLGRRLGHRIVQHGGGTSGFSSVLSRYPDDGLSIILLCNQADAELSLLERRIAAHYLPDLDARRAPTIEDPEPDETERIRRAVETLLGGEVVPSTFRGKLAELLVSPSAIETTRKLAASGPLSKFELLDRRVEHEDADQRIIRTYRAILGTDCHVMTVTTDRDGGIIGLRTEEAD